MLFAISGSQGSGKSTILAELAQRGYNVVQRKTSRSILKDWDYTLAEVYDSSILTRKFQDEIVRRKFEDEREAVESNEVWFTERTYLDSFVYATIFLGRNNVYSKWLDDYYNLSVAYNNVYKHVFYVPGGQFKIVSDGVRGENQHYGRLVDTAMMVFAQQMFHPSRFSLIFHHDIRDRVKLIEDTVVRILSEPDSNKIELGYN